jgi:hypothetical protein
MKILENIVIVFITLVALLFYTLGGLAKAYK